MRYAIGTMITLLLVGAMAAPAGWAAENQNQYVASRDGDDPTYMGKPLGYWLRSIRDRDGETMDLAFAAIEELGPHAWQAVPELTRIVAAPFTPIRLGVDGPDMILAKIEDIQLRSDAIDALSAIGARAVSATPILIRWALTLRVIPYHGGNASTEWMWINLVGIDVLERMRVAGAIAEFGVGAGPDVSALLRSSDAEGRKLAVAVLSEGALPIAVHLLKSTSCEERALGMAILTDMWPVVAREHLTELRASLMCMEAN